MVVGVIGFIHVGTFPYTVFKIGVGIVGDIVADFIYVILLLVFLCGVLA